MSRKKPFPRIHVHRPVSGIQQTEFTDYVSVRTGRRPVTLAIKMTDRFTTYSRCPHPNDRVAPYCVANASPKLNEVFPPSHSIS